MSLGRQRERQADMLVSWAEMPRSPGHVFYDKLQAVLIAAGFDGFVETQCAKEYAPRRGRPSLPPGRYFRMLLIGYFEGIDSERGLEWRCADSLSLREFLRLSERAGVPDHSWLSRTRSRLPLEVHDQVFTWVLERLAAHGLIKGERIGVDASTMEANAALRTIVRRDSGEGYREMLTRMARESGIETPTAEDLVRLDRNRKGKKLSNADWQSSTDPDARIARLKDGRTHLAYKPEHAMDLDTGAVVAAEVHAADQGDTATMPDALVNAIGRGTDAGGACRVDRRQGISFARCAEGACDGGPWKSRISEPHRDDIHFGMAMMRRVGRSTARSASLNACDGTGRSASGRRSPRVRPSIFQRCSVRAAMPARAQAGASRAPSAQACAMSRIRVWRSSRRVIRPRPCGRPPRVFLTAQARRPFRPALTAASPITRSIGQRIRTPTLQCRCTHSNLARGST